MEEKRTAVVVYPFFSYQEIACLTEALTVYYGRGLDVFGAEKEGIRSEDGFLVLPDRTFDAFCPGEYDSVVLPGIINPIPALKDERIAAFLRSLKDMDVVIAAISSAPLLLGRAGLLQGRAFACGVFEEILDFFDFMPKENVVRAPLCVDGKLITGYGGAYRAFAISAIRALGLEASDRLFQDPAKEFTDEDYTFFMGAENFAEFLREWKAQ